MPRKPATTTTSTNQSPPPPQLPSTLTDGLPLPPLIAFDLDYTLWPFWVDTHVTPPLKATSTPNLVHDHYGDSWSFYPDVPSILHELQVRGIKIAAASRTHAPVLGKEMLALLVPDPSHTGGEKKRGIEFFDYMEIFPGNKTTHFKRLKETSGVGYADMLFFDDEPRNRNVDKELGVYMCLVPKGVGREVFDKGVREWRKRRGHGKAARGGEGE